MPRAGKSKTRVPLKKRIAKSAVRAVRDAGADLAELRRVGRESLNQKNSVSCSIFRSKFGHYLDRVERGEIFFRLSRRGQVVAVLIPPDIYERLVSAAGAIQPSGSGDH